MKKPKVFFAFPLVVLGVADGQAVRDPSMPNPVRISSRAQVPAYLERSSVRTGDSLKLHFRLRNVSSDVIRNLVLSDFNDDCWLMVTDALGVELPRTEKGDRWRRRSSSQTASVSFALSPGEDDGDHVVDVAELYRLDRPGNYFVRIARRIGTPPDIPFPKTAQEGAKAPLEEAVSDLIPFTITP